MPDAGGADRSQAEREAFRRGFVRVMGAALASVTILVAIGIVASGAPKMDATYPIVNGATAAVGAYLAHTRRSIAGLYVLAYGSTIAIAGYLLLADSELMGPAAMQVPLLMMWLLTFLIGARAAGPFAVAVGIMHVAVAAKGLLQPDANTGEVLGATVAHMSVLGLGWILAVLIYRHSRGQEQRLNDQLDDIERVVVHARQIATGDLTGDVSGDDEVADVVREMTRALRKVITQVQEGVQIIASAANEITAMSTQQERGAVHQASAVGQTRETIQSVAQSSRKIAEATRGVLANAESTLRTNELAGERITALTSHTRRINELLEFIKDVSNKSELLALNAALEGTKAGEAGRGFSLVAAQMQRLAESTMATVKDVKALISDITSATNATVLSMEEATKLAADTTRAAREITLITQQQESSVEQVVEAMGDIATVTTEFAGGSKDTLAATEELRRLSERLTDVAQRFRV